VHHELGRLALGNDFVVARQEFEQAIELHQKVAEADRTYPYIKEEVRIDYGGLATVYVRADELRKAVEVLSRAVAEGWIEDPAFLDNRNFQALEDLPDFQKLREQLARSLPRNGGAR